MIDFYQGVYRFENFSMMIKFASLSDGFRFSLIYSAALLLIGILLILCHEFWLHNLSHTLVDLLGLLVGPILYSAFLHPRRFYLFNITISIVITAWVFVYIHGSYTESYTILAIVGSFLYFFSEWIGRMVEKQKGIEEELLFTKNALETRVELRTAELQFLNRQLTADIEMLKKADEARQQSETRLRSLINAIPDSILRIRCDGVCLEYIPGEGIDETNSFMSKENFSLTDFIPEKSVRSFFACMQKALETKLPQLFEFQIEQDGTLHDLEARMVVMSSLEILVMIRDMTERKGLEKEILEISQREQNRIGRDLHDGLGQLLTGISCLLQGLTQKMERNASEDVTNVNEISKLVKQAISQSSWLARGLMPVKLEAGGLEGALQELIEQTEHIHNIPCLFHCESPLTISDPTIMIHLYRIAQEALNNAIKHSHAKHIWIRLQRENGYVLLTVKDDGIGLPHVKDRSDGMGLRIMNYRAGMIGGELDISRDTEGGTIVQCLDKNLVAATNDVSIPIPNSTVRQIKP